MTRSVKKATASDVAILAGVSKWTVSRAYMPGASISEKAREKVMRVAKELGYRPNLLARSLVKKKTHIIGVVIDELKNPHTLMILNEATQQLQRRGYMALILNITDGEPYRSVMTQADQLQIDGVLFLGTVLSAQLITLVEDMYNIPLVQLCRNTHAQGIDVVAIDGYAAGKQIAELLLAQGAQRFGFMQGPDTPTSHLLRKEGFEATIQQAGYQIDVLLKAGCYDRARSWQAMSDYLQRPDPVIDALFCENDVLALGALEAMRAAPNMPKIAVVGFDDIEEARAPGCQLTTFSQRIDLLIAEALNRLIDGRESADERWRQGEMRVRRSHLRN
ncbi:LacI family DNA-binding transcriptional regulator [Pantoea sp. CTOTU49201]|uniref:LacI family DNA-binding transcriptional regulator n=1 Tax=Pantoea sp. CTOTU49201 TaxID=2953855 RepID=UPI0028977EAE|nr:LacI family DNA-binding transcriptional regulator [Pantoea sp. CTOTU49201]